MTSTASNPNALLTISELRIAFDQRGHTSEVLHGVDLDIVRGESIGLVGESGCGKSVTWLGVLGLLGKHTRVTGSVKFQGRELLGLSDTELSQIRGRKIAMIFQDPSSSLNPAQRVGAQIAESLALHRDLRGAQAKAEVLALLDHVEIPDAKRRMNAYPHELSGGMNQRVMIAMALAGQPDLLIADEPTTALDATVQAQILLLLDTVRRDTGMALVTISHDLGVISEISDRVLVMYAGAIVESAPSQTLFTGAQHPYSLGLLAAMPELNAEVHRLTTIRGSIPQAGQLIQGCRFEARCDFAQDNCRLSSPTLKTIAVGHSLACTRKLAA
ncbi:MAG: ABC transporter ATP-binding protein [Burkholderiaceae bacterium]|jgi:peptide/nickel transport system ATP-binding protein|nr:ABC transporter ATP-binding protein [Burkholderiaceae bacterium]